MGIFTKAKSEHGRGWVASMRESFHVGSSTYQGGPPVPTDAGRVTINGMPLHVPAIWGYYDAVGEFHYDAGFLGACLSRCTLRLGVLDVENRVGPAFDDEGKPLADVPVRLAKLGAKMIASLRSAPGRVDTLGPTGGQSMLLSNMGKNLATTAECYLVANKTATGDHWEVLSTMEMIPVETAPGEKQKFKRRRQRNGTWIEFTPSFYLRIFVPHPCYSQEADTAALPLLTTLERLVLLNQEGLADSKSRLKGPGVYWLASEIDFPATDEDPDGDTYMTRQFIATASAAIRDPEGASRHVPLVARAPMEAIAKGIRHDRFDYNDGALIEKRAAAVGDLARGAPLPYETTVGYGDTSFANAFAIDEQLARIFVSPVLELITGFLTGGWFTNGLMLATGQPLDQPPSEDIARLVVWYDVSDLVTSPDPTKVAQWAYGTDTNPNNIIGAKGVRRLLGIPEAEKPDPEEIRERMERSKALRARSEQGDNTPGTDPDDPMPEDRQDGERDKDEEIGKRVVGTAQTVAEIAASQAGNKLRSKVAKNPELTARIDGVDAADVARVLGPAVVESLGGTSPLLNGTFSAFERTVLADFSEAGREDAADLATAACKMAKVATLARLRNPTARLDAKMAQEFLDQLLNGRSQ